MRAIASWSARFRILVLGLAVTTIVAGAALLPSAAIDALPEFGPPVVEVQTEALGLSAEEVEQLVTVPLESGLLNGVAFLESIESESVQGLSSILLTFEPGTDPIRARQMVAERLTRAHALPTVAKPPVMLQPLSSANRLMMVSLASDELSLIDLSVLARWTIEPRLMGVAGVANVAIWGQRERQLQVLVDPERLRAANVTLDEVIATTGNALWVSPLTFLEASTPGTGGFIDTPNQRLSVQHVFPIDTAEDLGLVPLEASHPDASRLRLGDVADVVEDHQPLIGDAVVEDEPGLVLVIEKFPEANTAEVTAAVEDALAAMKPGLAGVKIDTTIFRPATFIDAAIANVGLAALFGLVLLVIVVTGLFVDWRAAIVSLLSVPLSLIAAALVLQLTGRTINTMVVAGLVAAVAVVIDDAVIGTHEIMRQFRAQAGSAQNGQRMITLIQAVAGTRSPMVYATVAILLATAPFFLFGEVTGALLPSALAAYLLALGAAMVVSLMVTPALAAILAGRAGLERGEPRFLQWLGAAYLRALDRAFDLARPMFAVVGVAALAVVVVFVAGIAPGLGASTAPQLQERDLLVEFHGAPGTSHTEISRIVSAASAELRALDGVRNVGAHVGRATVSDRVAEINAGEIAVSIDRDADYGATLHSIEALVSGYPGIAGNVTTQSEQRIDRLLDPSTDDITVRLYGNNIAALRDNAVDVSGAMAAIDGVETVSVEPQVDEPTIDIAVDLEEAADHGLRPGDIRRTAATLLSGIQVGSLFDEQKVFEVVVWGTPEHRQSVTGVEELLIETPDGDLVALGEIADVSIASSPTVIRRDGVQETIEIGAVVAGRDVGAVLADVEAAIAGVDFSLESHAEILGVTADRQAGQTALLATSIGVVIAIFLLLQAAFMSWRLAAMVFLALPAALAGGVVVALAIGGAGSIGTALGLLATLGLALRNGVGQVDHYRRLEQTAGEQFGPGLVLRGAKEQLAPVLMTALGTAAVLLPFGVLGGRAGLELVQPMALVITGGLISSTLINLFVVPALFLRSGARPADEMATAPIEQVRNPQAMGAR